MKLFYSNTVLHVKGLVYIHPSLNVNTTHTNFKKIRKNRKKKDTVVWFTMVKIGQLDQFVASDT